MLLLLGLLVVAVFSESELEVELVDPENENVLWKGCINIPYLGQTCAEVYDDPSTVSVGIKITVDGYTIIDEKLSAENDLLKLLELIPALAPFKPLIDKVVDLLGHIPASVFKVCVDIKDFQMTSTDVKGCVYTDIVLFCWEGHCAYKGESKIGCFDVPI